MISVQEALKHVLEHAQPLAPRRVNVGESLGMVLAEDVASDVESPPYDKAMVDGYAVVAADMTDGDVELEIIDEVMAGAVPSHPLARGQATRIMTGAPTPPGADAVVMVETTEHLAVESPPLGRVRIRSQAITPGKNILRRAAVTRRGDRILNAGTEIHPPEVGLLSEVGPAEVTVVSRPRVAVLSTGDELVPSDQMPGPGQIRNSNEPMLLAAVTRRGADPVSLGIGRDNRDDLRRLIERGLNQADVLMVSGGVSAGALDLVPHVLIDLGVEQVFHKVKLKPGKPLWFGVCPGEGGARLVFGLPGNPVSSLVCFELFVRPAMDRLAGRTAGPTTFTARLSSGYKHKGDRPTYLPAVLRAEGDLETVEPLTWKGSADMRTLCSANSLIHFPAGERCYEPGEVVEVVPLR